VLTGTDPFLAWRVHVGGPVARGRHGGWRDVLPELPVRPSQSLILQCTARTETLGLLAPCYCARLAWRKHAPRRRRGEASGEYSGFLPRAQEAASGSRPRRLTGGGYSSVDGTPGGGLRSRELPTLRHGYGGRCAERR